MATDFMVSDLDVLALGFGVIPLFAISVYAVAGQVKRHRELSWGFLAGVVAFLAVSHAMAAVILNHALFGDPVLATTIPTVGLVLGAGIAWLLLEGPFIAKEANRILATAIAFVGMHSFGDGLVLGAAFIGGFVPIVRIDAINVTATVAHRFLEGCLMIVPALAVSLKGKPVLIVLFAAGFAVASLVAIPAAYVPSWIFDAYVQPVRAEVQVAVPTFFAAVEGTLGLWLLIRAFLPMAAANRGSRWAIWTVAGFIFIAVVHFFVE